MNRAGLPPWLRLSHALRASRETELVQDYPVQCVTARLGNTPRIALKPYLKVAEEHFEKAASGDEEAAQNAAQSAAELGRNGQEPKPETPAIPEGMRGPAMVYECSSGGDRIRTCDLEVMSLASYRTAPPRVAVGDRAEAARPSVASSVFYP